MSRESHYTINVAVADPSRKQWGTDLPLYVHFFATDIPTVDKDRAVEVVTVLRARFPHPQYKVSVTEWTCGGTGVEL